MARGGVGVLEEGRLLRARELLRVAENRAARDRPSPGHALPVAGPLARLLPGGALRRGTVVALQPEAVGSAAVPGTGRSGTGRPGTGRPGTGRPETRGGRGGPPRSRPPSAPRGAPSARRGPARIPWRATGVTSLLWALVAEASARDAWIGVVGRPELGLVAAAEAGVRLERLALVPDAGDEPLAVASALLDGLDLVVVGTAAPGPAPAARDRLAARARQRGSVLLVLGAWPGADLQLTCGDPRWLGIGPGGSGRLRERRAAVRVRGRGTAAAGRGAWIALPVPPGLLPSGPAPAGTVPGSSGPDVAVPVASVPVEAAG